MQRTKNTQPQARAASVPLKRYLLWLGIILSVILIGVLTSQAAGRSSARSVGMGGAYIGLAKGVDAARYNPANLGLTGYRDTRLEIVGIGARSDQQFVHARRLQYIHRCFPDHGRQGVHSRPNSG